MHEYYRRSRKKLRRRMDAYLRQVLSEVEALFQKPYNRAFEEIWERYEAELLEVLPYIGGDRVSGTRNLTGCAFFIAFGLVGRQYGLSTHDWGRLCTTLYQRYFDRIPGGLRSLAGRLMREHPALIARALRRKDEKNAANAAKYPGSFVTRTMEGTAEYPVIYHTLTCPVYEFCRARGYMEYLPYLCSLDYVMFAALGVALHREKTCAAGDGLCDFKMKRDGPIPTVWPPHILDESDPLK